MDFPKFRGRFVESLWNNAGLLIVIYVGLYANIYYLCKNFNYEQKGIYRRKHCQG